MLNISYSAAYDPYHTAFRFLNILSAAPQVRLNFDWLRIADFYFCFPERLSDFSPPRKVTGMQGRLNRYVKSLPDVHYAALPESSEIFQRMAIIQDTALSALCRERFVSLSLSGNQRFVTLDRENLSVPLRLRVDENIQRKSELLDFLTKDFLEIELLGPGGLKDRSGLGEFQYDTI